MKLEVLNGFIGTLEDTCAVVRKVVQKLCLEIIFLYSNASNLKKGGVITLFDPA
jgi:hypothetical protein